MTISIQIQSVEFAVHIQPTPDHRIIIPAAAIIETGFQFIEITAVAYRIHVGDVVCGGGYNGAVAVEDVQVVAPGVVLILRDAAAVSVKQFYHIAQRVVNIIICSDNAVVRLREADFPARSVEQEHDPALRTALHADHRVAFEYEARRPQRAAALACADPVLVVCV